MAPEAFSLLYPERRTVSADQIERWFRDAVDNNEMGLDYVGAYDVATMAEGLADAGFITLKKAAP